MTTGAEVGSAILYRECVQAMAADQDLTGDTLLLAFALLDVCLREREAAGKAAFKRSNWVRHVGDICGWPAQRVKWAIGHDFPRYEPERLNDSSGECSSPMIRRTGECGQRGSTSALRYDAETGARTMLYACRRHQEWLWELSRRTMREWQDAGKPEPPHNTGGVLARHFTGNWDEIYQWAHPWRPLTPGSGKPATPPRPQLTLIRGEG